MKSVFSLELGMPHLGRNNLSEGALLKAIGHDRWRLIEQAGGVQSRHIRDDAGTRLYATFFFIGMDGSPQSGLSGFGENSILSFDTDLHHYSRLYLDGRHTIRGHPQLVIRSSNVFIHQEHGPSKLSLAVPANLEFSRIPELSLPPDSLNICREAKASGHFLDPEPGDIPLFEGEREFRYQIDADRDLNGAGLVYFANFVSFLDSAERHVLSTITDPVPASVLDVRSTYRRRIGYFGNAQSFDSLYIRIKARMNISRSSAGQMLDFGFDYRVSRHTDGKEILISSARKVAPLELRSPSCRWAEDWAARNHD